MASPVTALAEPIEATIASGASLSGSINLMGRIPVAIYIPSGWTSASLTFQASHDGTNFFDLYSEGSEVDAGGAGSQCVCLSNALFMGARHLKIRSGSAASPVNQGAARTLTLMAGDPST